MSISHPGSQRLDTPIEWLKGVGPLRASLLQKELGIFRFADLLHHFPLRHIDKTQVHAIAQLKPDMDHVQVVGKLVDWELVGQKQGRRLVAHLKDETGTLELTWFQGVQWVQKTLVEGANYLAFGKLGFYNGRPQLVHPEWELFQPAKLASKTHLEPIYPSTEKLKSRQLNGRQIAALTKELFQQLQPHDLPENIPIAYRDALRLLPRFEAYAALHYPPSPAHYQKALERLKFEELFIAQMRLQLVKVQRNKTQRGVLFKTVGAFFNGFYQNHLPFALTGAQKRVVKEIRQDTGSGHQMNRLLQGDVGSGKTMVALLAMLLAADNGYQSCLMAPTEILCQQHFQSLSALLAPMGLQVGLLTGSVKAGARKKLLQDLASGELLFLVGTHAVIEDVVQFKSLGLVIVDEQHRFGVAQRAKLWAKAQVPPHVLVMTATPIPRTLAMTAYGDLDYSIMDELPPGRLPVTTVQRPEMARSQVMEFVREEIQKGRQIYFIYPLIEESEKLSYEDLMQGYDQVKSFFPEPQYAISMVHGKQKPDLKEANMQRFVKGETQIMVSTTVIEVGVNVPNASVMVIESAEKFGLSQLHQLRGRVGRGSEKSFCILLTGTKASGPARERISVLCQTNDGFLIAEKDLEMRGPGDIDGTRQSGAMDFQLANLAQDRALVEKARDAAAAILEQDENLVLAEHQSLAAFLRREKGREGWHKIS
ncbi:MAG: ATP-dependent DNA helicase RecG [Sphingobacteriia bacterium]|nr:MAG: ATP-dependent DNA helicase RecG [Sphingobacteriia bacterium]